MARPSDYTQELADSICAQLAEGLSLRTVCKADEMPDASTVFRWLRTKPEFCQQYTRAKEESAEAFSEDMLEIADDKTGDPTRDRLRVDTRKWLASKLKPKKYGEKVETTHEAGDSLQALLQAIDGKSRALPGRSVE